MNEGRQRGRTAGRCVDSAGLRTWAPLRHYVASSSFEAFSNRGRDLVVQFTVKHEALPLSW